MGMIAQLQVKVVHSLYASERLLSANYMLIVTTKYGRYQSGTLVTPTPEGKWITLSALAHGSPWPSLITPGPTAVEEEE